MRLDRLRAGGIDLEVLARGSGRPILLIHGANSVSPKASFVDLLAEHGDVVAPSHPGFGNSPRPEDCDTMYDLVHVYRDVLDALPENATVIGFSFGGWIAAELAVASHPKLDRLVLVDPVGIKLGGREERDIVHFFNTNPAELARRAWHDPATRPEGIYGLGWQAAIDDRMADEDMVTLARNWDSLCLYAWKPHMYNPQLKHWLRRIAVPTLVLWGASDQIVTPDYGKRYAALIPGARFEVIDKAAHHPELEQPRAFVDHVARFMDLPGMMFIVRSSGAQPDLPGVDVKLSRQAPPVVADAGAKTDFFCLGEASALTTLRDAGWQVVELHDGYYEDGRGGGVAIWGQGKFWEIRSDPLTVTAAVGAQQDAASPGAAGEHVEVRGAIFGA